MSKKWSLILVIFAVVLALAILVSAIPQTFNINGKLTDSSNSPLSGTYTFNFSIYSNVTGGTALWNSGAMSVVTDSSGIYNVILNSVNLNFSDQYYLGIKVGTDSEMSPRLNLTSSPYAYMAQNVTVGGIIFDSNVDAGARNFTTTGTGLFGWLGTLSSRITKLFVTDLDFSGTLNGSGNITLWDGNQSFSVRGDGGALTEQFGFNSKAVAARSTAIGNGAWANGSDSVAVGRNATAFGANTVALGKDSQTNNQASVAIGQNAASWMFGVAIGANSVAGSSNGAIAIGQNASATSSRAIAIGEHSATTAANQLVIGGPSPFYFNNEVYIGSGVTATIPVNTTYHATGASGTDMPGGYISIAGGRSTGNATGGEIRFETSDVGATGSTLRSLTEKMRITGPGLVGIGTTTPSAILHVKNSSALTSKLLLLENLGGVNGSSADIDFSLGGATITTARISANRTKEGAYTDLGFSTFDSSSLLQRMIIKSDGKVGIGTVAPNSLLEVSSTRTNVSFVSTSANVPVTLRLIGDQTGNYINLTTIDFLDDGGTASTRITSGFGASLATGFISFSTPVAGVLAEKMRIDTTGNVGINTTAPLYALDVRGAIAGTKFIDIDNTNYYVDPTGDPSANLAYNVYLATASASSKVGIGTTTPSNTLDVRGVINASSDIYFNNGTKVGSGNISGGGTAGYISQFQDGSTLNNSGIYYDAGEVGIGTTAPRSLLDIFSTSSQTPTLRIGTSQSNGEPIILLNNTQTEWSMRIGGSLGGSSDDGFGVYNATDYNLFIQKRGFVGVGTSTPTHKLDVDLGVITSNDLIDENQGFRVSGDATGNPGWAGYLISLNSSSGNHSGGMRLARTSGTAFFGMEIVSQSRDGIRFNTNASGILPTDERMRITATGLVGIGTHAPSSLLHVNGTGALLNISSGTNPILSANATTVAIGSGRILTSLGGPQGTQPILTVFNNATLNNVNYTAIGFGIFEGINNPRASIFVDNNNHTTGFGSAYSSGGLDFIITTGGVERLRISGGVNAASGRVGIGTTIPASMLNVIGDANITTNLSVGGNFFANGSSVGIGTMDPGAKLDVNGVIRNSAGNGFSVGADTGQDRIQTSSSIFQFLTSGNAAANLNVGGIAITDTYPVTPPTSGLYVQGNVGIGTATPSNKLDVRGVINASSDIYFNNGTKVGSGNVSGGGSAGYLAQWSGAATLNQSVIFQNGIRIGIGVTALRSTLEVGGEANPNITIASSTDTAYSTILQNKYSAANPFNIIAVGGLNVFAVENSAYQTYINGQTGAGLRVAGDTKLYVNGSNVGIGTTNPISLLTLQRIGGPDLAFVESNTGLQSNASIGYASIGNMTFSGSDTSINASGIYAAIESFVIDTNADVQGSVDEGGSLRFNIWRHDLGGTIQQRTKYTALTIDNFAKLGINTTTPTQLLDVNGNMNMSSMNTSIYFGGSYITKSGSNMIISD